MVFTAASDPPPHQHSSQNRWLVAVTPDSAAENEITSQLLQDEYITFMLYKEHLQVANHCSCIDFSPVVYLKGIRAIYILMFTLL